MISLSSSLLSHGPSLGTSSVARLCDRDLLDLWFTHRLARNLCPFQRPSMNLSFWHLLPGCLVLSVIYLETLRVPSLAERLGRVYTQ